MAMEFKNDLVNSTVKMLLMGDDWYTQPSICKNEMLLMGDDWYTQPSICKNGWWGGVYRNEHQHS